MDFDPLELIGGALGKSAYALLRQRLQRTIVVPVPAVGADWTAIVPPGVTWEVLATRAAFNASAVVATRIPELRFTDPDGVQVCRMPPVATVAASNNVNTMWGNLIGVAVNSGGVAIQALPGDIVLGPGWVVRSSTFNIDVGDIWNNIVVTVREWSMSAVQNNLDWLLEQLRR